MTTNPTQIALLSPNVLPNPQITSHTEKTMDSLIMAPFLSNPGQLGMSMGGMPNLGNKDNAVNNDSSTISPGMEMGAAGEGMGNMGYGANGNGSGSVSELSSYTKPIQSLGLGGGMGNLANVQGGTVPDLTSSGGVGMGEAGLLLSNLPNNGSIIATLGGILVQIFRIDNQPPNKDNIVLLNGNMNGMTDISHAKGEVRKGREGA